MALRKDTLSRFSQTDSVVKDGKATFGLFAKQDFLVRENLSEDDILTISIDQSRVGRPDKIAEEFYETPLLEWVVVMFNRPLDPLNWPKAGTVIQLPTKQAVFRNI